MNNRDISTLVLPSGKLLVIACDSSGGIGPLENDQVKVPAKVVGKFLLRVPLMELLAVGARPVGVIDTLSVPKDPIGYEMIKGIKAELKEADLEEKILFNGSTEENIAVKQTGAGLTIIGLIEPNKLRSGTTLAGDLLLAVGLPLYGAEVLEFEDKIANLKTLRRLNCCTGIHEIIPVGSKGILFESEHLASSSDLRLRMANGCPVDLEKSAGPATVLLVSLDATAVELVKKVTSKPVNIIGRFENNN